MSKYHGLLAEVSVVSLQCLSSLDPSSEETDGCPSEDGYELCSLLTFLACQSNVVTKRSCLPRTSRSAVRMKSMAVGPWLCHAKRAISSSRVVRKSP